MSAHSHPEVEFVPFGMFPFFPTTRRRTLSEAESGKLGKSHSNVMVILEDVFVVGFVRVCVCVECNPECTAASGEFPAHVATP